MCTGPARSIEAWSAALVVGGALILGTGACGGDGSSDSSQPTAGALSPDAGSAGQLGVAGVQGTTAGVTGTTAGAGGTMSVATADGGTANDASADADAAHGGDGGATAIGRNCKRGVAYNHEMAADTAAFGGNIGWWYNWGSKPDDAVTSAFAAADVEFVPMAWSGPPERSLDAQALIDTIPEGARYLLAFNEPNFGSQASLTPEQAADAWPVLEQVAKARALKIVSPAVNYCGGDCNQTDPFVWLDEFFAACTGCQVDYVAFHWYACSLDALKWVVDKYETRYGKPVWLTEFACLDDPGDHSAAGQLAYMQEAVPFLESDPMVFRYAWFIGRSSTPGAIDLFADPGMLTPLGTAYAGLAGDCD